MSVLPVWGVINFNVQNSFLSELRPKSVIENLSEEDLRDRSLDRGGIIKALTP
jgi:hypothetical protein